MKKLLILFLLISSPVYAIDTNHLVLPEKQPEIFIITKTKIVKRIIKNKTVKRTVPNKKNKIKKVTSKRKYVSQKTLDKYSGNVTVSYRNKTITYRKNPPWQ